MVAGVADHITPWQSCFKTLSMLGGEKRFVLSTSGHIAALVNPPGNPKATYQVNPQDRRPIDPQDVAERRDHGAGQLVAGLRRLAAPSGPAQSGRRHDGSARAGTAPLVAAPGTYVFDR